EHLIGLGLDRFAFCGFEAMWWSQQRRDAFCQTVEEAGHRVEIYRPRRGHTVFWVQEEPLIHAWLSALPKPICHSAASDDRASSILASCRALGYGVAEDISVIGIDDDPYICELANPPLTSVAMASDRAGYDVAELLHKLMRGKATMSGQRILAPAAEV